MLALRFSAAILGLLILLSAPARATMMVRMSDESLVLGSAAIVSGTVTDIRSAHGSAGEIHTYVTLAVDEVLKGYVPHASVTIRERGGRVGDDELWLFGNPHYEVGESTIVFLDQDSEGFLRTNQMALGKFGIEYDATGQAVAARQLDNVGVIALGGAALQSHETGDRRPADEFKARLRDIVRTQPVPLPMQPLSNPVASADLDGASATSGFTLFNNTRWFEPDDGNPVRYWIDQAGDDKLGPAASDAAMAAAFAAWTNVPNSSLVLEAAGSTAATPNTFCDGTTKVIFNDPYNQVTDPNGCGGILAIGGYCAGASFRTVNGVNFRKINEGDIVFNNGWTNCAFWNSSNVAEVATHEVGHTIGLGHSTDGSATMYSFAHFDGRGASLRPDDEAGVAFIYPGSGGGGGDPTPTPTPTVTPPPTPAPPDADGDGVQDANDNCPTTHNTTQTDIDSDGVGDACDNCAAIANADQSPADACGLLALKRMRISFGRRGAGDRLQVKGSFNPTAAGSVLGEIAGQPVRMSLFNSVGERILDVTIPAGNWKANRRGTRLMFKDRSGQQFGGLTRVTLNSKRGPTFQFSAAAKNLDLSGSVGPELTMTLEIADDAYVSAQGCETNRRATRMRCSQRG